MSVHAPCRRQRLAALSFASLQRLPESGVHFSRVYLTLSVPLSGFVYPLSGLLLPKPLNPFSDSSVPGIPPSRAFLPSKSRSPLEDSLLSWRWIERKNQKVVSFCPRLQSFAPFEEASSLVFYDEVTRRYSPGLSHLWGFLPSGPGISFKLPPLLHFSVSVKHRDMGALESFCQKIGLTSERPSNPSDVFGLLSFPIRLEVASARAYLFHREYFATLLPEGFSLSTERSFRLCAGSGNLFRL